MWSRKYDKCIVCGTIERKHICKGMCGRCRGKNYYKNNLERCTERRKMWCKENSEKVKEVQKKYYLRNRRKCNEESKKWRKENPEKYKEICRRYREKNLEKCKEATRRWIENNYEKHREWNRKYRFNKKHNDIRFKLRHNISNLIRMRIKRRLFSKNGKSTFDFVSYSVDDLMKYLENLFQSGMTWENYGKWHIDHIKPDLLFNYKSVNDKEFQECWALKNLQPLWAMDNWKKGNN